MSKWFGESESKLAKIFNLSQKYGRIIIFFDEIDSLAISRNFNLHEGSRRILSVLLRKIDSFESSNNVLIICATNRKEDLDKAMLSRVDLSIRFDLPKLFEREQIFKLYAKHLNKIDLKNLAKGSSGLSGRNINNVCQNAERKWASKIIRNKVNGKFPDFKQYEECLFKK